MRAARLHGARDLRLHDEPLPTPGPEEELVRVEAVGLCGSDLHWYQDGGIGGVSASHPIVPGHEMAGRTREGHLVAVDPAVYCNRCRLCLEGHPNLCPQVRFSGHGQDDGSLREWMAWPRECLIPLPEGFTAVDGALLEPLGVAVHAVDLAHLRTGDSVGVFGCGPIGLFCLQVARAAGAARLFATELASRPHRIAAARALGAEVVAARNGDEGEALADASGELGLDVAIECAGAQPAVDAAVRALRPGARLVIDGIPSEERTSFPTSLARRKGLTVAFARRMKRVYPRAIALVRSGQVDLRSMVTHTYPLSAATDAFETAVARRGLKVVVQP